MADIPLEKTLVVLKQDAVARGLVGAILGRFEQAGLAIIAAKLTRPSLEFARKHYPASDRQFEQMGSKTLETYRALGLDPKERLGTGEAREIGKLIHEWNAEFLSSGPVLGCVIEGVHAVQKVRKICGKTIPLYAEPGTIRGDYSSLLIKFSCRSQSGEGVELQSGPCLRHTILSSAVIAVPETIYYAFVTLQQGKMSTSQGNVVLLSDLIDRTTERAAVRVREANAALDERAAGEIAAQIAVGAIRYGILSVGPSKNVTFDLERALQFEGSTGPYIQYSCTRITSILQKTDAGPSGWALRWDDLHEAEWALVLSLARYPEALMNAWGSRNPAVLCNYLFGAARAFSRFYHDCPVLTAAEALKVRRLALCRAALAVLSQGLNVLGIEAPEKM